MSERDSRARLTLVNAAQCDKPKIHAGLRAAPDAADVLEQVP